MLKSKLNATKYPTADPKIYLVYDAGVDANIDPILEGRLAAFTRDYGKGAKLYINSGYRSIEKQKSLFFAKGGKYDTVRGYYWPDSIPVNKRTVAKPGKSFHNFRLAIDTRSLWAKLINKIEPTKLQRILLKYGLFKPMTKGNGSSYFEDWHFQPIETLNVPLEKRKDLMPEDVPDQKKADKTGIVIATILNIRTEPKSTAKVCGTLTKDVTVKIVDKSGDWYQIGVNRWVSSIYVKV